MGQIGIVLFLLSISAFPLVLPFILFCGLFLSAKITFLSLLSFIPSFLHVLCHSHLLLFLFSTFLLLYSFVFSRAKMSLVGPCHCLSALDKHRIPCKTASIPFLTLGWSSCARVAMSPSPFSWPFLQPSATFGTAALAKHSLSFAHGSATLAPSENFKAFGFILWIL